MIFDLPYRPALLPDGKRGLRAAQPVHSPSGPAGAQWGWSA